MDVMCFTICLDLETSLWAIRSAAALVTASLLAKAPLSHPQSPITTKLPTTSKFLGVKTVP